MDRVTYVRAVGQHVAERVRPAPGSPDALRLAAAANDPGSPWQREDVPVPAVVPVGRPPQAAAKDAWVTYAIARGAGEVAADLMTKADLISTYGGS